MVQSQLNILQVSHLLQNLLENCTASALIYVKMTKILCNSDIILFPVGLGIGQRQCASNYKKVVNKVNRKSFVAFLISKCNGQLPLSAYVLACEIAR